MDTTAKRPALWLMWGLVLTTCFLPTGCVQRRLTVCSNPPGALVRVDDVEIGTTPVSTSFIYYGTRKIQLIKPGYETLTILQPVRAPWYQWPGIDFFSEHFVPSKISDDRLFTYNLQLSQVVPTDQLLERAEQLREQADVPESPESIPSELLPPPLPSSPPVPGPYQPAPQPEFFPGDGRLPF